MSNQRALHVSLLQEIISMIDDGSLKSKNVKNEIQSIIDDDLNFPDAVKKYHEENKAE